MYPFVTHTWNAIKGACPHDCSYCYCKRWGKQPPIHFDEKELKTDLGEGNFIFVGSSCDMWAESIPHAWISAVLLLCRRFPKNKYLFQSKNPVRFGEFYEQWPNSVVLGTTLESDIEYPQIYGNAPRILKRYCEMMDIPGEQETMITIEPILDFNLRQFADMIYVLDPKWVNIGADSKGHNLPEPPPEKIQVLIDELKTFTEVKIKKNLRRILQTPEDEI